MKYILIDINPKMVDAWRSFFDKESNVTIEKGDLTKVKCDAIVSPANAFGFMDGGVDHEISVRLGWDLQVRLQEKIKSTPEGEILIGKSMIMETNDELVPYLIASPTMRVPMNFNISTSVNAYLAMKATLIEAKKHPKIETIAIPGFCTGVGGMAFEIAARQMYKAFDEIENGNKMNFADFGQAQKYHFQINPKWMIFD
jgi:O-acetyl-ADP-ribose deacetylase (regulator of RNase III)